MTESIASLRQYDHLSTLPPSNLEAEESILGGILLDSEAINRVVGVLSPEAFYLSAHQIIYKAALTLHETDQPTDFMSVTSWLYDHKLLDEVGGQPKIAQLLERTVSAVNIDQYAALVMDKHLRRQFIQSGNEISKLATELETDLLIEFTRNRLTKLLDANSSSEEKHQAKYNRLMEEAEKIILYEDNPGKFQSPLEI